MNLVTGLLPLGMGSGGPAATIPGIVAVEPIEVKERHDATGSVEPMGDGYGRKYSDSYYYFFPRSASQAVVLASCGYLVNQPHPDDPRAYVSSITASNPTAAGSAGGVAMFQWLVTVNYSTVVGNGVVGGPLDQPAKVTRKSTAKEGFAAVDYRGEPCNNTAGDPYLPPLPKRDFESAFRVEKNIPAEGFDFDSLDALVGKVNESEWNGFPAKSLLFEPFDIPEKQRDEGSNVDYRTLVLELAYNRETWVSKVPSLGFRRRDPATGELVRILDHKGEEKDDPTLLDEDGDEIAYPADAGSIVLQEFEPYEPISFAALDGLLGTLSL